ncbi:NHL domain-containing protein [Pelomonas sp. BJYL3]|uniref:NHL domain-containing protein n=1 Tax=Pelomonas sp. BJYL3 TaxID=2976697 RepID=UPI0022B407CB|nr:hypothetical protein [Pelomonas sp. BJYL3]
MRRLRLLAGMAWGAWILAGCGGGGGGGSGSTDPKPVAPAVAALPASVKADAGTALTLSASVSGDPRPSLQWQRSNDGGTTWVDVTDARDSQLTLAAVSGADQSARFRLKASNSQGQVLSSEATLTVTASVKLLAGSPGGASMKDGTGAEARFTSPGVVIADGEGFTLVDADSRLRTVSATGEVRTLSSTWSPQPNHWWMGLALDKDGNYIAASASHGTIYGQLFLAMQEVVRIDRRSGAHTVLWKNVLGRTPPMVPDGPWTLAVDASNRIWLAADQLLRLEPSGDLTAVPCKDMDTPANNAACAYAGGLAFDGAGNLYFSSTGSQRIRYRNPAGEVRTLAGATDVRGADDGQGAAATFYEPKGLVLDGAGQLLVLDQGSRIVRSVGLDGKVKTLAGKAFQGDVVVDGVGSAARFSFPQSLAINAKGQVAVTDTNTVRLLSADGTVRTLAGRSRWLGGKVDGPGESARFRQAASLAKGSAGELFIWDIGAWALRRVAPDGVVSTVAQSEPVRSAEQGLAAGPAKSLYMADAQYIWRLNADGSNVPVILKADAKTLIEDMEDLSADAAGDLYVADTVGLRIRKVSGDGKSVTTLAGLQHVKGSRDGGPDVATFEKAHAAAVDARGNVYVADGSTVRKVSSTGVVSTIGGLAGQATVVDGPAATARFADARRIAVDSAGNVLVLDGSQRLRRIAPDGSVSTVHTGFDLRSFTVLAPGRVAIVDEDAVFLVSFL